MNVGQKLGAIVLAGVLGMAFGAQAGDTGGPSSVKKDTSKKPADEDLAEVKVRLRLIAIETATHLKLYEKSFATAKEIEGDMAFSAANDGARLPEYQRRLQHYQSAITKSKKALVDLEVEKAKLTKQLGATKLDDGADALLERILGRLNSIDKRLEKMGR